MTIADDLEAFFSFDAVTVTNGIVTSTGLLDMPSEIIADGAVLTTDYKLTVRAGDFGGLLYGDGLTVNGINYTVRNVMLVDDGRIAEISLMKIAPPAAAPGGRPREFGLQDLADVNLINPSQGDILINDGTDFVNTPEINGGGA
jgi:hypothetical protein